MTSLTAVAAASLDMLVNAAFGDVPGLQGEKRACVCSASCLSLRQVPLRTHGPAERLSLARLGWWGFI